MDKVLIFDEYAGSEFSAVTQHRDELQLEYDNAASGLADEEKRALYLEYQKKLHDFEVEVGLQERLDEIADAIEASAQEHGVEIVLDIEAVVLGGVDLTLDVARRLGLTE